MIVKSNRFRILELGAGHVPEIVLMRGRWSFWATWMSAKVKRGYGWSAHWWCWYRSIGGIRFTLGPLDVSFKWRQIV